MKKVIFLVLVFKSFVFCYDSPNPAIDKLTLIGTEANTCLASGDHPINTFFYQDSNHNICIEYTPTVYTSAACPDGKKYNKYVYAVSHNHQCPSGQEIINGACAVPPTCPSPQIWNSDTDTCECPPPPTGYTHILHSLNTPELCSLVNASMALDDGDTFFLSNVIWDSCRNQCLGALQECPCNTAIKNGACVDITPPDGSCPDNAQFSNIWALCVGDGCKYPSGCTKQYLSDSGFICYTTEAGCCLGDSGNGGGSSDSNSTNPDTNTTNPGDPGEDGGEDGEEDGGETGGGDSNTSTPAPGDSNTSTPAPGDSNTSTLVDRALLDEDGFEEALSNSEEFVEGVKEQFDIFKENVENHLSDIEGKYISTKSLLISGTPPVMSSGGSLDCASFTFNGRTIHLDLSKVSIIQPVVYYIFTAFFMFLNFVFLVNHLFRGLD